VLWGAVAQSVGIANALLGASVALVIGLAVAPRHKLGARMPEVNVATDLTSH
jgi:hypothetical protein